MRSGGESLNQQWLGASALIATAALWGTNHVVARAAHEVVPLPALVFWRWFLAATILTVVALPSLRRCRQEITRHFGQLCLGGSIGVGVFSYLLLGGAYASPALEVGIINATTPVWVTLIGLLMGHAALSIRTTSGLILALLGTVTMICQGRYGELVDFRFGAGNLLSLLGAMTFAWFSIRARTWARVIEPLALTVVTAWFGLLFVMLPAYGLAVMQGTPWLHVGSDTATFALAAIVYVALGPTMLGNLFYLFGVAAIGPVRAASFLYLSPVFSALLAITWLNEALAWFHVLGASCIIGGLLLMHGKSPK